MPQLIHYMTLRKIVGLLGFALPLLLTAGGELVPGSQIRDSLSSYYYSNMQDVFVGTLCMVGIFLYAYKGYPGDLDGLITSICGVLALLVALFPTRAGEGAPVVVGIFGWSDVATSRIHYAAAVLLFVGLASISTFFFTKTSGKKTPQKELRNRVYQVCGGIMFAALLVGAVLSLPFLETAAPKHLILIVEWICLWAFSVSWAVKGEVVLADKPAPAVAAS